MSGAVALAEAAAGAVASAAGLSSVAGALGFGDFAALGPVSFMLLGSPEQLSRQRRSVYGKLAVIGAPPVMQWIYDDLEQLTMSVRLHTWWCVPDEAVALLDGIRTSHQPQPLVFGTGIPLGALFGAASSPLAGQYVITDLTATDEWRYAGVAQHIDCKLTLSQWVPALPPGAPSVQPPGPTPGVIGAPAGLTAVYAAGATLGLPLPSPNFASVALAVVTRAGAP
ncbi:MAG: phage tail protein [Acetobacteraceae bacterium]